MTEKKRETPSAAAPAFSPDGGLGRAFGPLKRDHVVFEMLAGAARRAPLKPGIPKEKKTTKKQNPSPAATEREDFRDFISYLRDYIVVCKEKGSRVPLYCWSSKIEKDTN